MGGAIASGLSSAGVVTPTDITVCDPSKEKSEALNSTYGVNIESDNAKGVESADIVVVAVKPWLVESVIQGIKHNMDYSSQLFISIAAGVDFATLASYLDCGDGVTPPIFRVIPNTAISIQKSVTFIAKSGASDSQIEIAKTLFSHLGEAVVIDEEMMAAGTSLASCGIAFALKYLDASIAGGVELGFTKEESRKIVLGTMKGALALLDSNDSMPQSEIDKVTTPGGITLKGLEAMAEMNFNEAVKAGLNKSR